MTQEDAAAASGVTSRQIRRIERGRANMTLASIVALAATYGVSVRVVLE
jgi:transcriptional regulator with XRE-family HTH domain